MFTFLMDEFTWLHFVLSLAPPLINLINLSISLAPCYLFSLWAFSPLQTLPNHVAYVGTIGWLELHGGIYGNLLIVDERVPT